MNLLRLFIFPALIVIFTLPANLSAQEHTKSLSYSGHSTKFAFLITTTDQFLGVIETAKEMGVKKNKFSFEIVVAGKLAKDLTDNEDLLKEIDKAEKLGLKIVVCEGAISYFKVEKSKLDKRLLTTPNAWVYMFELKDKGFNTLSL